MNKATLYGVSVGPGDPELMTLKAVKTLARCTVIATPITSQGNTLALTIAAGAVDIDKKTILKLHFAMTKDKGAAAQRHKKAAQEIIAYLENGQDVAMLNLGDSSLYATFSYIAPLVEAAGYGVEVIPGVTSFCASAARLGVSLTDIDRPLHIIPAAHANLREALSFPGTKVLMKSGSGFHKVAAALRESGTTAMLVENCGLADERVFRSLDDVDEAGYFATILIRE